MVLCFCLRVLAFTSSYHCNTVLARVEDFPAVNTAQLLLEEADVMMMARESAGLTEVLCALH